MRPGSIVRWKSFWLGVLVLVFLGWGWASSRKVQGSLYLTADQKVYAVWSGDGSIHFMVAPYPPEPVDWGFDSTQAWEEEKPWFAPAFEHEWERDALGKLGGHTAVAYWVVVLGFLGGVDEFI